MKAFMLDRYGGADRSIPIREPQLLFIQRAHYERDPWSGQVEDHDSPVQDLLHRRVLVRNEDAGCRDRPTEDTRQLVSPVAALVESPPADSELVPEVLDDRTRGLGDRGRGVGRPLDRFDRAFHLAEERLAGIHGEREILRQLPRA